MQDTALELGPLSSTGKLIPILLNMVISRCTRSPCKQIGFSHTLPIARYVLQHRCDYWASAGTESVTEDLPRASKPQAILRFPPPCRLDYKARHGPQTVAGFFLQGIIYIQINVLSHVRNVKFLNYSKHQMSFTQSKVCTTFDETFIFQKLAAKILRIITFSLLPKKSLEFCVMPICLYQKYKIVMAIGE